ncbi:MAG: Cof-type HAD-IIB family hydrolase [Lachnospiraceae bacterium]|nr:Cof-type HAD-IIB family hydrolase [Lachnospiraceae bacterium]
MKLLFTDLDGTLLNNDSQVSDGTKAFLDDFLAAGNKLILSSGRPKDSVLEVKNNAGLTQSGILLICSNGTQIYDCDSRTTIMEKRLPLPYVPYLQEQASRYNLHIQTYREDAIVSPTKDREITFYRRRIHLPLIISPNLAEALTEAPFKMLAISLDDFDKLESFRRSIADWAEGKIQTIYSSDMYLELFEYTAGKGNAVRFVCDHFGVPLSDAYAAGDADNDISMLEAAGCGIAMANATDKVKQSADIVTELDNDRDGLVALMRKLL